MFRLAAVLVCLLSLASSASAQSGALAGAEAAYARGSLREARRQFEAALVEDGHTRDELIRIHVALGVVHHAFGAPDVADQHFAIALALAPHLAAPGELAPDVRSHFESLRPASPLTVVIDAPDAAPPGEAVPVSVHVEGAPTGLVVGIELSAGELRHRAEGERLELTIPSEAWSSGPIRAVALAAHGVELAETTGRIVVAEVELSTEPASAGGGGPLGAVEDGDPPLMPSPDPALTSWESAVEGPDPIAAGPQPSDDTPIWIGVVVAVVLVGAGLGVGLGVGLSPTGVSFEAPVLR